MVHASRHFPAKELLNRSEGVPGTVYFIPGHVGGWGWTGLGRSSGAFPALVGEKVTEAGMGQLRANLGNGSWNGTT